MLSRVAERLFWMARYLERAENSARLLNVYSQSVLDLPHGVAPAWDTLLWITASGDLFEDHYQSINERNVIKFLLADIDNPGSVVNSVRFARENARTTREILPDEAWELINALHVDLKANAEQSLARRNRYQLLQRVCGTTLQLTGLLEGALNRGKERYFMALGRNLERADTSSRVLDVGAGVLLRQPEKDEVVLAYEGLLWTHQLKTLQALHAYRTVVGPRVEVESVISFLVDNTEFPRALGACLEVLHATVQRLPRPEVPMEMLDVVARRLVRFKPEGVDGAKLHQFLDTLQKDLIKLQGVFDETWFHAEH